MDSSSHFAAVDPRRSVGRTLGGSLPLPCHLLSCAVKRQTSWVAFILCCLFICWGLGFDDRVLQAPSLLIPPRRSRTSASSQGLRVRVLHWGPVYRLFFSRASKPAFVFSVFGGAYAFSVSRGRASPRWEVRMGFVPARRLDGFFPRHLRLQAGVRSLVLRVRFGGCSSRRHLLLSSALVFPSFDALYPFMLLSLLASLFVSCLYQSNALSLQLRLDLTRLSPYDIDEYR
jgi:hypothetical protein